ncbi:MAG: hypothetical protein K9G48_15250 [Reyranella sp.]|nr:hypothetical protein [Reyranella sp.]
MTDPFSPTYRNSRKFTRRRERQMAFLKALGETGSVAHAAAIVDVDRTTPYTWRNMLPGFASTWEATLAEAATRLRRRACFAMSPGCMNDRQLMYLMGKFSRRPCRT